MPKEDNPSWLWKPILRRPLVIAAADHAGVVMLSYSPRQLVTGFWQRALMPLIFSELEKTLGLGLSYSPDDRESL
jgi:hypothetical protein